MGADLLRFLRKITEFLESFGSRNLALAALLLCGVAYRIHRSCNYHHGRDPIQDALGQKILLFADDTFGYDKARRMLKKVSEMDEFEVVIPFCVTDWLGYKMLEGGPSSQMATASLLMIQDLLSLGRIRLQTTEESGPRETENDVLSYEDRIINSAIVLRRNNPHAMVVVVSSSDSLRSRARDRNLRSCGPLDLLA